MKPIGYIYLTTCLANGKIYIGRHEFNGVKNYLGSGTIFKRAVKKYGKENFKRKILRLCYSLHELRVWEHVYIVKYKSYIRSIGYNIAKGDVNSSEYNPAKSPEVREKIRKAAKKRMSIPENNPMYGKHWSDEVKEKIRIGNLGKRISEEQKKLHSDKMKGKNNPMYGTRFLWINNGVKNKRHNIGEEIPNGWFIGMIKRK